MARILKFQAEVIHELFIADFDMDDADADAVLSLQLHDLVRLLEITPDVKATFVLSLGKLANAPYETNNA